MRKIIKNFLLLVLTLLNVFGSCNNIGKETDITLNDLIAKQADRYIIYCPTYFIPPAAWRPPNNTDIKNTDGCVAWSPLSVTNNNCTKEEYLTRLENAFKKDHPNEEQTSYDQYQKKDDSGFPGIQIENVYLPEEKYIAGFCCYFLLSRILEKAGIPRPVTYSTDEFINDLVQSGNLQKYPNADKVNAIAGDIVAYKFVGGPIGTTYGHVGVIVKTEGISNPNDFQIVSACGFVDFFKWGARQSTIGVFTTPDKGGLFSWWTFGDLNYDIYKIVK